MAETNRKFDREVEQTAAEEEPMGSVAAAVSRDEGSAVSHDGDCPPKHAPSHEGGNATLVAGTEAQKADKPKKPPARTARKR
jgi:hypothetical protein